MKRITATLLRAKHWHLFLAVVLGAVTSLMANSLALEVVSGEGTYVSRTIWSLLDAAMACVLWGIYGWWCWAVGSLLITAPRVREGRSLNLLAVALSISCVDLVITAAGLNLPEAVFIPLAILGWGSLLYVPGFLAVRWVEAEHAGRADLDDLFKAFLLFFFFPIGVWIIQPRVNELFEQRMCAEPGAGPNGLSRHARC